MVPSFRCSFVVMVSVLCVTVIGCNAQNPTTSLADSHIEANVPKGKLFDQYLKRDLTSYFCNGNIDCRVEYEFLRKGPTQTGISYPKYYLWARSFTGNKLMAEGAVRVAAVEQTSFDVTHFLTAEEIVASPDRVGQVFPAALVENIISRARHQ